MAVSDLARSMRRIAGDQRRLLWVVAVLAFVLVLPAITFFVDRTVPSTGVPVADAPIFDPGMAYRERVLFSLPAQIDEDLAASLRAEGTSPVTLEVIAPSDDGRYWVVDHPADTRPYARARLMTADGTESATFLYDAAATLFTPGPSATLWAVTVDGATGAEQVVVHDATGALVATLPVPDGVAARSIVFGRGDAFVLNEEWAFDPQGNDALYAGVLYPVAIGAEHRAPEGDEATPLPGTLFFDPAGNAYVVEPVSTATSYEVIVRSPEDEELYRVAVPAGYRPYAADADGRIYAESPREADTDTPGHSTIGDAAGEVTLLRVFDRDGEAARLTVPKYPLIWGWAPPAWVCADGRLVTWTCAESRIDLLVLQPAEAEPRRRADGASFDPDVTVIVPSEPVSGDPYDASDVTERDLFQLVYDGLVSLDASLTPVPEMAEEVPTIGNGGVSADGLTIRYTLRGGQSWHDGKPVTAEDVVATWRYLLDDPVAGPEPFPGFSSIRAVRAEGLDVVVELDRPFGAGPECFFPYVLPSHLISGGGLLNAGVDAAPLGSGPFTVVRWEAGGRWLLRRADEAAVADGEGRVDTVEVVFADGESARAAYLGAKSGVWTWADTELARTMERDGQGTSVSALTGRWVGSVFDSEDAVLSDDSIRESLVRAYPKDELMAAVYGDRDAVVDGFVPGTPAHDAAGPVDDITGTAAGAGDTLDGVSVGLSHASRDGLPELVPEHPLAVEDAWTASGAHVKRGFATPRFYGSWWLAGFIAAQDHSVAMGVFPCAPDAGWGGVFDPADAPSIERPWGAGVVGGGDEALAALYERARASYDPDVRDAVSREITARIREEHLAIFDYYERRTVVVSASITGVDPAPYPAGDFWNAAEWRLRGSAR